MAAAGPVRALLARDDGTIDVETVDVADGAVPSIVDLVPAAGWDEREAHDLYGIRFDGHEPLRPLVNHDLDLASWTVAVQGPDAYQVAVGPIHAGVIESGHFRFHLVGEKILHLDARLFYKHRGLERAAEGAELDDGIRYMARACAACAVTNGVAYAQAVEQLFGYRAGRGARARSHRAPRARAGLEPPERHLGGMRRHRSRRRSAALRRPDRARAAAEREPHGAPLPVRERERPGQPPQLSTQRAIAAARRELAELRAQASSGWRELLFNRSFQDRLSGVGVVRSRDARRLGASGPAARASGLERTRARQAQPRLRRLSSLQSRLALSATCSAGWSSATSSSSSPSSCSSRSSTGRSRPARLRTEGLRRQLGAVRVESPRGATLCVVERDGDRVARVHLRTGSYANWPVVAHAAAGNMLPDFPLINKSFELCYACADR